MTHFPIILANISFSPPQKTCFEGFSAQIYPGQRIGIMGQNGQGKTTLLNMIRSACEHAHISIGHVPQIVNEFDTLSGGQRFQKALGLALSQNPNVLCLDEPTNHLDQTNRKALLQMIQRFSETLIIVSHDIELLKSCVDELWHIHDGRVTVFHGGYEDYWRSWYQKRGTLLGELKEYARDKKQSHVDLMHEQERAKKRKLYGEKKYEGDTIALRSAQAGGQGTVAKNRRRISQSKAEIMEQLNSLRVPELIQPTFHLSAKDVSSRKPVVSIGDGSCGYDEVLLDKIQFQLGSNQRIALNGDNGSGKTTFVKAILGDAKVTRDGSWQAPSREEIGYLDQHYQTLLPDESPLDVIWKVASHWTLAEVRRHLNDFLFRKNEEVNTKVSELSGGECARLAFAQIAARPPKLLILDEVTNNLDIEARAHVVQVLQAYRGAMIVISHDEVFLGSIGVIDSCEVSLWRATQSRL